MVVIILKFIKKRHLNNSWYGQLVNAELSAIVANVFNSTFSPYGNGTAGYSPIIALGESWAYYMGHFMADMRYGNVGSCQKEQVGGTTYCSNTSTFNPHNSHIDVLEFFDPNLAADPFKWIPKGLYQDLRDATNELIASGGFVNDNVSNYTNQQFFNSFNSGITTMQGYRTNLLNTTTNSTSGSVAILFSAYHY